MLYSNFRHTFWYTPKSERGALAPARFLLKTLPYLMYNQMTLSQELPEGVLLDNIPQVILDASILAVENIENPPVINWYDNLSEEIRQELIQTILDLSVPTTSFTTSLAITIELAINPRFSDGSWDCTTCQTRRLDRSRNCPYLDKEEYHEDTFSLSILGETHIVCPMAMSDSTLVQKAFEAYNIRCASNGLPHAGGLDEQAVFYVIVSEAVNRAIESEKARQEREAYAKHRG